MLTEVEQHRGYQHVQGQEVYSMGERGTQVDWVGRHECRDHANSKGFQKSPCLDLVRPWHKALIHVTCHLTCDDIRILLVQCEARSSTATIVRLGRPDDEDGATEIKEMRCWESYHAGGREARSGTDQVKRTDLRATSSPWKTKRHHSYLSPHSIEHTVHTAYRK